VKELRICNLIHINRSKKEASKLFVNIYSSSNIDGVRKEIEEYRYTVINIWNIKKQLRFFSRTCSCSMSSYNLRTIIKISINKIIIKKSDYYFIAK